MREDIERRSHSVGKFILTDAFHEVELARQCIADLLDLRRVHRERRRDCPCRKGNAHEAAGFEDALLLMTEPFHFEFNHLRQAIRDSCLHLEECRMLFPWAMPLPVRIGASIAHQKLL